jgi:murein DD-endopeptidase MepM/ murein hydrolase activator NlpD
VRRRPAAAVLAAAAALWFAALPSSAGTGDRIRAQQSKIGATKVRLDAKRSEAAGARERERGLRAQLDETNRSIDGVTAHLGVLAAEVRSNEKQLAWNKTQLDAAEATLARHTAALNRRLVDAYENGDLGYANVLLHASSFNDFVERWDDIRYLIAANQRTIRERRDAEETVAAARLELRQSAAQLEAERQSEERARAQLAALAAERAQLVAVADEQRRSVESEVSQLEEISQEEENSLEALIAQKQREEEERRRAEAEARRRAAALSGESAPGALPEPGTEPLGGPGDLSWPVSGPITSPFGMRLDPVSGLATRMHTGIDIGAPMGATIEAAAEGRVIIAGWDDGGYGNMVVVDHGGGVSTLYGHCSQVFVAPGQDVQRGQAIAAVGSTGHSTGPHLHFEVRIGGKPVDPTSRLH